MTRSLIHTNDNATQLKLPLGALRKRVGQLFLEWRQRRRYRAELCRLLAMGPELMADLGMTVEEAEMAAGLPFWKPTPPPESKTF